jgi:hypothetical protein
MSNPKDACSIDYRQAKLLSSFFDLLGTFQICPTLYNSVLKSHLKMTTFHKTDANLQDRQTDATDLCGLGKF